MSKPIKVEDHVYEELDALRGKGETFSQVIETLTDARIKVLELISVLEGSLKFREWQEKRRLEARADFEKHRTDQEVPR